MIPVLFIISIVIFGTVKAMPGDEVTAYFGAGSKVTQEQRDHVRELLGLDKSLPEQYVRWVGRMCTGDLGSSITLKKPVGTIIGDYVWNTFYLNVVSLIVALIFAIPVGIKQAVKKGSVFDNFWTVFSLLGISVPTFFFALVLIFFIGLNIPGMPINGMRDTMLSSFGYSSIFQEIGDIALHSILPVIVLAFSSFASFSRYVRNSMVEVINMDYVRTARSKGLKEKTVIYKHAFKNAQLNIQIHLFLDVGISRCQRFDFCIGQRGIVHIITGTDRRFRGHDLRDEFLLIFQNLPHIRIERIFCDVTENLHFLVAVSLTKNPSFLLFQVRGFPRAVQMMQGNQPVLNVCTSTKFWGRTKQDTHLTGTHLCKQFCLFGFGICLMDESNLLTGDSLCHQFLPNIIVYIECSVCFRGR